MPNNVTSRVRVKGDVSRLKKFAKEYIRVNEEKGELFLDFEKLIPMPKSLREAQSGSSSELNYEAWYGDWKKFLEYAWIKEAEVKTRKQLQDFLEKRQPGAKAQAELYKKNKEKYGFASWYEWSVANWGTKWNSYSFQWVQEMGPRDWGETEMEFLFDTAWSVPVPIFEKLSEAYVDLDFKISCFDEQWNFACKGGFHDGVGGLDCFDATKEMYKEVYGEEPPEDPSDEP